MGSPETELVSLLRAASELDRGRLLELAAEPLGVEAAAHAAAHEQARAKAREAIARSGMSSEFERAWGDLIRWSGAGGAQSGVWAMVSPPGELLLADLRRRVVPRLMDVLMANVLGDALDEPSRVALLGRWRQVARSRGHDGRR
jgi:hypothetical protein